MWDEAMNRVLITGAGDSGLSGMMPGGAEVQFSPLSSAGDFRSLPADIDLVIVDLENCRGLPEQLLGIRSFPPLQDVPVWGILDGADLRLGNLFFAFGGQRLLRREELAAAAAGFDSGRSAAGRTGADPDPPPMTDAGREYRLARQLDYISTIRSIAGMKDGGGFDSAVERILEQLFRLIRPHIAVILLNNNLQAAAFVKPAGMIFMQDYLDFRNFCLNDFYIRFPGINLESIRETFFTGDRDDFDKMNLDRRKLSSYIFFPILNRAGRAEATVHLGHLRNNYFSDRLQYTLGQFIDAVSGSFYYSLRTYQAGLRKTKLLNIFERFVPPEIIPELIKKEHDKEKEKVEKREIAVLFSDIRSFTTITEENGAQQVVDFLNRHFDAMVSRIKKHGGAIDKFIGDAIVATFGMHEQHQDNSVRAVRAAVEMLRVLPDVDCSGMKLKNGSYGIGIGIHEGAAIIGNVGSPEKADYTAIGDVTGIAEELEALTKNYETNILVSEYSMRKIGGEIGMKLEDRVSIGQEEEIGIFSPEGEVSDGA